MSLEPIISSLQTALADHLLGLDERSPRRIYVQIRPQGVLDATRLMMGNLGARFQTATGADRSEAIEVLYHWALDGLGCVVTIRTLTDRAQTEIESITPLCPAAEWIEREMWELLGIRFTNHPDLRHLLLGDDWPEGKYPLRRDYHR